MKKVLFVLCLAAIVFSSCKKNDSNDNPYVGTYVGQMTSTLQSQSSGEMSDSSAKQESVVISQGPGDDLMLYRVFRLAKKGEGYYTYSSSEDILGSIAGVLLQYFIPTTTAGNITSDVAQNAMKNLRVEARFSNNTLTMRLTYDWDIQQIGSTLQVGVSEFHGTKK